MAAKKRSTSKPRNRGPRRPRKPPARRPATKSRAKRVAATRGRAFRSFEQRHLDLLGLACVATGVFLAFPLYLSEDGGRGGDALTTASPPRRRRCATAPRRSSPIGGAARAATRAAAVKPFRAGGMCLLLALALGLAAGTLGLGPRRAHGLLGRDVVQRPRRVPRRGAVLRDLDACWTIGAHIVALFLFVAGLLLLTGATIAGVVRATAAASSTRRARCAPQAAPASRRKADAKDATAGGTPRPDGREPDEERSRTSSRPSPTDVEPIVRRRPSSRARRSKALPGHLGRRGRRRDLEPTVVDRRAELRPSSRKHRGRARREPVRSPEPRRRGRTGRAAGPRRAGAPLDATAFAAPPRTEHPQALQRRQQRPTPPGRRRPRAPGRGARALRHRGEGHRHRRRPAHHPLRAAARARRQDEQGRPPQGRPRLRAGRDRHPHPRADPRQARRRRRGPQPQRRIVTLGDVFGARPRTRRR